MRFTISCKIRSYFSLQVLQDNLMITLITTCNFIKKDSTTKSFPKILRESFFKEPLQATESGTALTLSFKFDYIKNKKLLLLLHSLNVWLWKANWNFHVTYYLLLLLYILVITDPWYSKRSNLKETRWAKYMKSLLCMLAYIFMYLLSLARKNNVHFDWLERVQSFSYRTLNVARCGGKNKIV